MTYEDAYRRYKSTREYCHFTKRWVKKAKAKIRSDVKIDVHVDAKDENQSSEATSPIKMDIRD